MARTVPERRISARLAWGLGLLAVPARVVRAMGGTPTPGATRVVRVLGARQVAQALVTYRDGGRHRFLLAAVDGAHAATALALAAGDRRWRRPALTDAAIAVCFGLVTVRATARPAQA
ncbi:MAG: hypothetical protein ACRDY3_00790 [Acidimicrobiales bacterium]